MRKGMRMEKKIGYKVVSRNLDINTKESAIVGGKATAFYHPNRITRSLKFRDGSRYGYPELRLPLLVFDTLKSAKNFVENQAGSFEIWEVSYIPGCPFLPTISMTDLITNRIYYPPHGALTAEFPYGTVFASCLKLIKRMKINKKHRRA